MRRDPSSRIPSTCIRRTLVAWTLGALLLQSTSCSDAPNSDAPNILFILLDTLRADRLGAYGSELGLTPALDTFARDAVLFERAYAHAPWTLPSAASIFTSQTPLAHGAGGRLGAFQMLPEEAVTLAEVLRDAGYTTAAITNVLFLGERFGAMQGFDTVDHQVPKGNELARIAANTTETALTWLDNHSKRPFFLLVHFFDPHLTYDPPQPYRSRFANARDKEGDRHVFGTVQEMISFRRGKLQLDAPRIERLEQLHNGDVAYMDAMVGRLLEGIEARGLLQDTVIVVTSDHGEEFADHGGFEHGHTLYDELLHVPLMLRIPTPSPADPPAATAERGRRVARTVRHLDLAPSLLELAGVEVPDTFTGTSLLGLARGVDEPDRPVLSTGNMWGASEIAWRRGGFKLIQSADRESARLFEVEKDPGEQVDVSETELTTAAALAEELRLVRAGTSLEASGSRAPDLTEGQRRQLEALGYAR